MAEVRLNLLSAPESVSLLRAAVTGFARAQGLDEGRASAIKTAVSEAASNVVIHAYGGKAGPLSLVLATVPNGTEVLVRDRGRGFGPIHASQERLGLGLAVISALADRAEFGTREGGGTEVRLLFDHGGGDGRRPPPAEPPALIDGDVTGLLQPGDLAGPVLGPLFRALAARSHFSVARIAALGQVTGALEQQVAQHPPPGPLFFSLSADNRLLDLRFGPLPAAAGPLGSLPEQVSLQPGPGGDYVRIVVGEAPAGR